MGTRVDGTVAWQHIEGSEPESLTSSPGEPQAQPAGGKSAPEDTSVDASQEGPSFSQYLSDEWDGMKRFAESPVETTGAAIDRWADDFDDCASAGKQIAKLGVGDDCTFKLGVGAGVERFEAEADRSATVRRDGTGYTVALARGGEVTVNFKGKGQAAALDIAAGVKTGTRTELHFKTAEEADRAVQIFARQSAAEAAGASMPMFNIGTHSLVAELAGPSAADQAFLARAKRADQVEVGGLLKLEGGVGPESEQLKAKFLALGVEAEPSVSAKITYDADGKASGLVVESHFKIAGQAEAGAFREGQNVSAGGGKHELEVTTSQTYALPKGVTLAGHDNDPIEFAAAYAKQLKPMGEAAVKVGYEAEATGGRSISAELELRDPAALAQSDVLDQLLDGNVRDALSHASDALDAKGALKIFDTSSHHLGGKGLGASLQLESTRRHAVMDERFGE